MIEDAAQNEAFVSTSTPSVLTEDIVYTTEEEMTVRMKENFLQSMAQPFPIEIKSFDWVIGVGNGAAIVPCTFDLSTYDTYNSYVIKSTYKISKKFRVKIPHNSDAFHGIRIPCIDPKIDIKSVTLFCGYVLPIDPTERLAPSDLGDGNLWVYNEDRCRRVYVPVKKVTNISSNRIIFDDQPIMRDRFFSYSVEIEYSGDFRRLFRSEYFGVEVEEYYFLNPSRQQFLSSARSKINNLLPSDRKGKKVYLRNF